METEIRMRVAGLRDEEQAHRAEAVLHSKVGIRAVEADAAAGTLRLLYDSSRVSQPRLQAYLKDAGVRMLTGDAG